MKHQLEEANKQLAGLLVFLKESLSDRVEKVTLTSRLLDSPCALVTSKFGWSANMERIMKAQSMGDSRAMEYMKGRKILEVNPEHEIVRGIKVRTGGWLWLSMCDSCWFGWLCIFWLAACVKQRGVMYCWCVCMCVGWLVCTYVGLKKTR